MPKFSNYVLHFASNFFNVELFTSHIIQHLSPFTPSRVMLTWSTWANKFLNRRDNKGGPRQVQHL